MKANSLSILCALFLAGGCRGTPPKEPEPTDQLTLGKVQGEIQVGLASAQVVQILGSPNIITTDEQRREVWVYDKISTDRMNASTSAYGTLLLFGGRTDESRSSTRQRTLTIVIKFDEAKKVRDFAYNYTQF
jgi:outer membrane protein assembly factor BamE (lipoprotein component of BamABCDE complex)